MDAKRLWSSLTGDDTPPDLRQVAHLRRALGLVWQSGHGLTVANLALIVLQGVLPLFGIYLTKLIVDGVAEGMAAPEKGPVMMRVGTLIALSALVTMIGVLARSVANLVNEGLSMAVTDRVQELIHAKSVEVDLEYYENAQYYDMLHRAQQEAPYRPTRILSGLLQVGQNSISLVTMVGLLFSLHWLVALVVFLTAVPTVVARLRYSTGLFRWQKQHTAAERLSWYFSWLLTRDAHAKEVRLFDLGAMFRRRYHDLRQVLRRERLELSRQRTLVELAAEVLTALGVFGSYAFIAYRAVMGVVTLGGLVMYYQAFQRAQGFVRDTLSALAGLYEDSLFLSHLYDFLGLQCKVASPAQPRPVPSPMRHGITFEHVYFRYPNSSHDVLEDINLHIRPGEVIALVGENGSGKTTLVKLLCRLYDPSSGRITVDDTDLRAFETAALRRHISVIFQDYARYNLSARENIWFGNVALAPNDAEIVAAARTARADEVIRRLPKGYDSVLGKWFADGEELSAGEWQKVALARAFLRQAQIIVLDEPTSSLDARTEYEVFSRFRELARGRSTILISHRFSTVRMADTIYMLEDGRISESGSHDELVRLGGAYAHLFAVQAQSYRD